MCHPNRPEEIAGLLIKHDSYKARILAEKYLSAQTDELRDQLTSYYQYNWCKVRAWGNFNEEVTFRICTGKHNWYPVIVRFLKAHPMFKNSTITVESDTSVVPKAVYWDKAPYSEAINKTLPHIEIQ
jgi:hypothetical protein